MENNSLSLYGFDQISILTRWKISRNNKKEDHIHTIFKQYFLTGWCNSNQEEIRKQKVNLNCTYLKIKNEKVNLNFSYLKIKNEKKKRNKPPVHTNCQ